MKLYFKEIPQGKTGRNFVEDSPSYDGLVFLCPVEIEAEIFLKGKEYFISTKCKTAIENECSKCLKNYSLPIDMDRKIVVSDYDKNAEDSEEDDFYNIRELEGVLNIFEYFCEEILITRPISAKCDYECKGICEVCGKNLNKDICDCK